jgi:hypothetical protein
MNGAIHLVSFDGRSGRGRVGGQRRFVGLNGQCSLRALPFYRLACA